MIDLVGKELALVFVLGILLMGCTGSAPQATPTPAAGGTVGPTSTIQAGATAQATVQGGSYAGMAYADLLALGVPLECTMKVTSEGTTINNAVWMKGGKMRMEGSISGTSTLTIYKDEIVYTHTSAPGLGADCYWYKMSAAPDPQATVKPATQQLSEVPPTDISCHAAAFGDEKFATTEKVCDLDEMMASVTASMPPGYVECSDKEGQELVNCMQQYAQ